MMQALSSKKEREEITPSQVWLALTSLPRPQRLIPLPRINPETGEPAGSVVMWPLSQEEIMSANAEADRYTKALLRDPQKKDEANLGYHHTFTNEVAIQVLYRACRNPDDVTQPAFPSPNLMRPVFTTDETGVLFDNYCTVQSEVGPIVAHMSDEEYEAMILRLAEGGSAFPFDSCSWEARRQLVLFMASRLVSCWTVMSSLGLPLDVNAHVTEWLQRQAESREAASRSSAETAAAAVTEPITTGA